MRAPLVAVLDYGIGNLRSAQKALQLVGADARLTADVELIAAADGVVLPGVGAFGRCMEALAEAGLADVAAAGVADATAGGRPFLGVCVGMQMLFEGSDETPGVPGLGALPGWARRLPEGVKHPQMQWNVLDWRRRPALAAELPDPAWVYFVHSYAVEAPDDLVVATCDYGGPVAAMVERGRCWATQFHPEKSSAVGLALLAGFVAECGADRAVGAPR
ncbi:MAG TPA: imidazole glycerol phosphate synthase subunit HisH [Acidimicrobiales bacterium]|nr:imidazole glycerol phosphate synthase subunit HisH [Acidimicrobiales bacterium]